MTGSFRLPSGGFDPLLILRLIFVQSEGFTPVSGPATNGDASGYGTQPQIFPYPAREKGLLIKQISPAYQAYMIKIRN